MNKTPAHLLNGNRYLAYFAGIVAATSCMVIHSVLRVGISNFESATNYSQTTKILHLLSIASIEFFIGLVFCLVTTAIPFFVAFALAKKLQIKNIWFFIVGGMLMGALLAPVFALLPVLAINGSADMPTFAQKTFSFIPSFSFSGIIAGIVTAFVLMRTQATNQKVTRPPQNNSFVRGIQ